MKLTVNAPAKINLTLDIIGRRNDGYHLVKMLMQSVDVCDTVTVWDDADSPIQVFCNREEIPVSEANTAYRAAQAFFEAAQKEDSHGGWTGGRKRRRRRGHCSAGPYV